MKIHSINKNTTAYKDLSHWAKNKAEVAALNKAERVITDGLEAAASKAVQTKLAEIRAARFAFAAAAEETATSMGLRSDDYPHGQYIVPTGIVVRSFRRETETVTLRAS